MLEQADFILGRGFWTETGCLRCTVVGTRTLCAIKLDGDPRKWNGRTYSLAQHIFDENDFGAPYTQAVRCARPPEKRAPSAAL